MLKEYHAMPCTLKISLTLCNSVLIDKYTVLRKFEKPSMLMSHHSFKFYCVLPYHTLTISPHCFFKLIYKGKIIVDKSSCMAYSFGNLILRKPQLTCQFKIFNRIPFVSTAILIQKVAEINSSKLRLSFGNLIEWWDCIYYWKLFWCSAFNGRLLQPFSSEVSEFSFSTNHKKFLHLSKS